jgi:hypothetical protein
MVSPEALFWRGMQILNYYPEVDTQEIFNVGIEDAITYAWSGSSE